MRTSLWVGGTLTSLLCCVSVSSIVTAGKHFHGLSGFLWWLPGWMFPDHGNGSLIQEPVASQISKQLLDYWSCSDSISGPVLQRDFQNCSGKPDQDCVSSAFLTQLFCKPFYHIYSAKWVLLLAIEPQYMFSELYPYVCPCLSFLSSIYFWGWSITKTTLNYIRTWEDVDHFKVVKML